jgi:hypothetical protein
MTTEYQAIGKLAYRLWEARGRRHGYAEQDWLDAERELRSKQPAAASSHKAIDDSLKQSFPASDPPSSHFPDEPPVNADAKWAAAGVVREGSKSRASATRRNTNRN